MNGSVFQETLRRSWRAMLYWGVGLALYGYLVTSFIQDADMLKQFQEVIQNVPPALLQFLGTDAASLATPEGFVATRFFTFALLILAVYAIVSGLNVTANEEDQGIMDILLSLPLPRRRLVVEKFLAYSLGLMVILAISFVGLLLGNQNSALKVDGMRLLESTFQMLPGGLLILAFTTVAGVTFRTRGTAAGAASVFVIASYFLNFLGEAASETFVGQVRALSFFYYYDPNSVIRNGINWGSFAFLALISVTLFAASIRQFQRRDIGL